AALVCATGVTFLARGQGVTPVVLLSVLMATAALVGVAALRTLRPLLSPDEDRTAMVGSRTRVALEREKALTLRSIKELEFDRAMGKLSDSDWQEMSGRLRARAARLMRQLDAGAGFRAQIARDVAARTGQPAGATAPPSAPPVAPVRGAFCAQCGTASEADARFCKNCGQKL
ncbi:MAG: zinc ribbon domain-containing protein, partial [Acidobacteriota bacterium]